MQHIQDEGERMTTAALHARQSSRQLAGLRRGRSIGGDSLTGWSAAAGAFLDLDGSRVDCAGGHSRRGGRQGIALSCGQSRGLADPRPHLRRAALLAARADQHRQREEPGPRVVRGPGYGARTGSHPAGDRRHGLHHDRLVQSEGVRRGLGQAALGIRSQGARRRRHSGLLRRRQPRPGRLGPAAVPRNAGWPADRARP